MKKYIVFMGFVGLLILNISWMLEGCNGKLPPLSAIVPTSTPTLPPLGPQWVDNFESGSNTNINPYLFNSNNGVWSTLPAGNFVVPGGANGTAMAARLSFGPIALSGYTPYQLVASPNATGLYNLNGSPYTGIQFYWKTGLADNMPAQWFICPVPAQVPPPLGNCPGPSCYDTFKKPLGLTGGTWVLKSYTWAIMTQAGWGSPATGPLNANSLVNGLPNLSQIMYFQWEEDPNNVASTYTIDFWVDEIQLF